jgi:hypothetical protein
MFTVVVFSPRDNLVFLVFHIILYICVGVCTAKTKCRKLEKKIFPEKEYRGLSPYFHIHVSVSELYIPTMGLPFLLEEICGPILGIYKSLTDK